MVSLKIFARKDVWKSNGDASPTEFSLKVVRCDGKKCVARFSKQRFSIAAKRLAKFFLVQCLLLQKMLRDYLVNYKVFHETYVAVNFGNGFCGVISSTV